MMCTELSVRQMAGRRRNRPRVDRDRDHDKVR
jgi:hypothetical protein